jgi:hypothetical protein
MTSPTNYITLIALKVLYSKIDMLSNESIKSNTGRGLFSRNHHIYYDGDGGYENLDCFKIWFALVQKWERWVVLNNILTLNYRCFSIS